MYTIIQKCLDPFRSQNSEVLETLRSMPVPAPFPTKDQHIPAIQAARDTAAVPSEDDEEAAADPPKKRKSESAEPWNYSAVRNKWIDQYRIDQGVSYKHAKGMWETCDAKRNYLKNVSINELKRRKLVPKGTTKNPWSD